MNEDINRIKRLVDVEKTKLFSTPLSFYSLSQLEIRDYVINLSNGDKKIIRKEDIYNLKKSLPEFLHEKLKIPVIINITLNQKCKYQIRGEVWQARVVEMLLRQKVSWEPNTCLSEEEVAIAIRRLGSLIHFSFKEDVWGGENESLEE
uniref:DUF61 family protein n=1 Tax=Fervidicoccus fontis TaxID=683846 RepID=A0A7C1E3C7_9CREN